MEFLASNAMFDYGRVEGCFMDNNTEKEIINWWILAYLQ